MHSIILFFATYAVVGTSTVIEAKRHHTATVILSHGRGGGGAAEWASKMSEIMPHVKWVLPSAPGHSWYDISHQKGVDHCRGIDASTSMIESLIEREKRHGIPYERIVLAGYSQGCAMSLWTGLQFHQPLGGIACIAGYLPRAHAFRESDAGRSTPVFHVHGEADSTVPLVFAMDRRNAVLGNGHPENRYIIKSIKGMGHDNLKPAYPLIAAAMSSWIP